MENDVRQTEDDEEHENDSDKDDDEFIATQDSIHNNSNGDEVTSTNYVIVSGEDVNISTNLDGKRKAGSGDEKPEKGKKQNNDDQE